MLYAALLRLSQLYVTLITMSANQGKVIAPSGVKVRQNQPVTIYCKLELEQGETLKQILWRDNHNQTLFVYHPGELPNITDNQRVTLESPTLHTTGVTIKKVSLEDKDCYMCVFFVYPSGSQERSICLEIMANLSTEGNKTAFSGKLATLSCQFSPSEGVKLVHWKKTEEQGDTRDVAVNSKDGKPVIEESFKGRVMLSSGISDTNLYIKPVRVEDEGCYTCEFAYYDGMASASACLAVYVLPKTEVNYRMVSPGIIEANCTALTRPAVQIRWDVEEDNRTLSPPVSSVFEQGDGTLVVHSTLLVQADLLKELPVKCLVYHPGLESPISVSLNTKIGKPFTVLISVTTVAALLILCLCIYLWNCVLRDCQCFPAQPPGTHRLRSSSLHDSPCFCSLLSPGNELGRSKNMDMNLLWVPEDQIGKHCTRQYEEKKVGSCLTSNDDDQMGEFPKM